MSQGLDFSVSERGNSMSGGGHLTMLMGVVGVLQSPLGVFMACQMIRLPLLFGHTMSMRGDIVQFGGALVVFVM